MAGSIYDIAVHLSAVDKMSGIFKNLALQIPGVGKELEKLEKTGDRVSGRMKLAFAGIGGVIAGSGILEALKKLEHHGEGLVHVKTMFEAALPAAERHRDLAIITAKAYAEAGKNMQSTVEGNIDLMHDLYTVTQSVEHATKLLGPANALRNAFASVKDQEGLGDRASGSNIASAIRAFELTGRNTEERIAKAADMFVNTTIAFGSKAISGGQLMTQISNSGDARYGWSDDFLTQGLPAMIATGLQNRTGQALYQGFSNLYGGVSSSLMQGKFQEKWGIHKASDELKDHGKFKGFKVGSMWEADVYKSNPIEWANDYRKKLAGMGVNVEDMGVMQRIIGEIGRGNKGLKSLLDEVLLPQTSRGLNKEIGNVNKVGADARDILGENDPGAWHRKLEAQFKNVMDSFGEGLVKPYIEKVLKPLSTELKDLSQWAGAHPELVAQIGEGVGIFGAALAGAGGVALLGALGPAGWLVLGLGAAVAVVKTLKPEAMKEFGDGFKQAWEGILHRDWKGAWAGVEKEWSGIVHMLPDQMQTAIVALDKEIRSWPARLLTAVESMGSSLVTMIGGVLKGLAGKLGDIFSGFMNGLGGGISYGGPGLGGGGLINASFGGGSANDNVRRVFGGTAGGGALGSFIPPGAAGGSSVYGMIEKAAGGDSRVANTMKAIFEGESNHQRGVYDHARVGEDSVGPFQLNKHGGLGALFMRETGLDPANPNTVQAQANWVANYIRHHRGSLAQWRGLPHGIQRIQRGQVHPKNNQFSLPSGSIPTAGAPPANRDHTIHVPVHIDGKIVASVVTKHRVADGRFPTSVGGPDTHGHFTNPGTPINDAA